MTEVEVGALEVVVEEKELLLVVEVEELLLLLLLLLLVVVVVVVVVTVVEEVVVVMRQFPLRLTSALISEICRYRTSARCPFWTSMPIETLTVLPWGGAGPAQVTVAVMLPGVPSILPHFSWPTATVTF